MLDFKLAIIYWFYKEPEATKDHLEILKKNNPNKKIYGLFGGDEKDADLFEGKLGSLLDDFWVYPGTYGQDPYEKWIHGDLVLLDWYDKNGRNLEWDSVAVTQWDMLVFDDLSKIFSDLKKDQVMFSGYRRLDEALENRWSWTRPDSKHRKDYENFVNIVREKYKYDGEIMACLYMFEVLTRSFLDKYLNIDDKKVGMLEYKNPTLAKIFDEDIYEKDMGVFWGDRLKPEEAALIATKKHNVSREFIESQLSKEDGWRIFHPFKEKW